MKFAVQPLTFLVLVVLSNVASLAAEDPSSQSDLSARRGTQPVLTEQPWEADSPVHFAVTNSGTDANSRESIGDCCQDSCRSCAPCWTFRGGTIFLERSNPSGTPLAFFFGAQPSLNAGSFNFDTQTGWDIGAQRRLNDTHSLDFRHFQVDGWNESIASATAPSSLVTFQTALAGVGLPHFVSASYGSLLRSAELNIRRDQNDCVTLLAGFRYLNLQESLFLAQTGYYSHQVETYNHLYGAQIGAEVFLGSRGRFGVDGWAKAGIYGNNTRFDYELQNLQASSADSIAAQRGAASFVGDLGFSASYRLTPNVVLRGGYQLLWIDGVALAADQFNPPASPGVAQVETRGDVFYHGALCGLEVTW